MDRDHSYQLQADLAKARKKHHKRSISLRTPSGSPPPPGTSGASGSSQLTPPPPLPSTNTNRATFTATQETSPIDNLINDDSIPDEQVYLSNDEDIENDHLPKADIRKDWWKPLPEEERPATPKPA
ncbi:hypothetical protein Tco_0157751 [Tanacetum coccineum]